MSTPAIIEPANTTQPMPRVRWREYLIRFRFDAFVALALFVCALALRLPFIRLAPPLWDSEMTEALDAAKIALGQSLPLVLPSQPHLGPVAAYPLALVLRIFGLDPFTPRVFVAVLGAFTVVATFFFARVWGGRLGGLIAGALLAANPFHILINSHVFWTNSITPLLTTLALTCFVMALEKKPQEKIWLPLAFFLLGLALQSHPSVLALLPGLALWLLARRGALAWLRERWTWVAAGAGVLAYSNFIVFNLVTGFRSIAVASAKSYALPTDPAPLNSYPTRLRGLANELLRMIGGNLAPTLAWNPVTFSLTIWFGAALLLNVRKGRALFFWLTLSTALIIGYSNKVYGAGYAERYIMFLLPIAFAAMGLAVEDAWHSLRSLRARIEPRGYRIAFAAIGLSAVAILIALPPSALDEYYRRQVAAGRSNHAYLRWAETAATYSRSGYRVLIDRRLDRIQTVGHGSSFGSALDYLLRMRQIDPVFAEPQDLAGALQAAPEVKAILLLDPQAFETLRGNFLLCPLETKSNRVLAVYSGSGGNCSPP